MRYLFILCFTSCAFAADNYGLNEWAKDSAMIYRIGSNETISGRVDIRKPGAIIEGTQPGSALDWTSTSMSEIRFYGNGEFYVQPPCTFRNIRFVCESSPDWPSVIHVEGFMRQVEDADYIANESDYGPFTAIGGVRDGGMLHQFAPTVSFINCEFVSAIPWQEASTGLISLIRVDMAGGWDGVPVPFRVAFIGCKSASRATFIHDGHPIHGYQYNHIPRDIVFRGCDIAVSPTIPEPLDPRCVVMKGSRGYIYAENSRFSIHGVKDQGNEWSTNIFTAGDSRINEHYTEDPALPEYGNLPHTINVWAINSTLSVQPSFEHGRNAAILGVSDFRLEDCVVKAAGHFTYNGGGPPTWTIYDTAVHAWATEEIEPRDTPVIDITETALPDTTADKRWVAAMPTGATE